MCGLGFHNTLDLQQRARLYTAPRAAWTADITSSSAVSSSRGHDAAVAAIVAVIGPTDVAGNKLSTLPSERNAGEMIDTAC
jgi:hypothetical protein